MVRRRDVGGGRTLRRALLLFLPTLQLLVGVSAEARGRHQHLMDGRVVVHSHLYLGAHRHDGAQAAGHVPFEAALRIETVDAVLSEDATRPEDPIRSEASVAVDAATPRTPPPWADGPSGSGRIDEIDTGDDLPAHHRKGRESGDDGPDGHRFWEEPPALCASVPAAVLTPPRDHDRGEVLGGELRAPHLLRRVRPWDRGPPPLSAA